MSKDYRVSVDVKKCEKLDEVSTYNWNIYQLPFSINDRNVLICQGDDDRTEFFWLITEQMLAEKDYHDKLAMWCRDVDDDQSVFEFDIRYFGEFPS